MLRYETLDRTRLSVGDDVLRVYRAPLFLLRKSLPPDRSTGNAMTSYVDIAFSQSYYGYSAQGNESGTLLVRYLHLFAHSNLWNYILLATSPSIGTERPVFLKSDFDSCPLIALSDLSRPALQQMMVLSKRLEAEDSAVFPEIDSFFGNLYGLSRRDLDVVEDTLAVRNPHDELGIRGSTAPTTYEVKGFCSELKTAIRPFAKRVGREIRVAEFGDQSEGDAFRFIVVTATEDATVSMADVQKLILSLADRTGASMIIQAEEKGILVGILNQYRYWTRSRARLLAADILRDHFANFEDWKGP